MKWPKREKMTLRDLFVPDRSGTRPLGAVRHAKDHCRHAGAMVLGWRGRRLQPVACLVSRRLHRLRRSGGIGTSQRRGLFRREYQGNDPARSFWSGASRRLSPISLPAGGKSHNFCAGQTAGHRVNSSRPHCSVRQPLPVVAGICFSARLRISCEPMISFQYAARDQGGRRKQNSRVRRRASGPAIRYPSHRPPVSSVTNSMSLSNSRQHRRCGCCERCARYSRDTQRAYPPLAACRAMSVRWRYPKRGILSRRAAAALAASQLRVEFEFPVHRIRTRHGFIGGWLQILIREAGGVANAEDMLAQPRSEPLRRLRSLHQFTWTPQTGPFSTDTWAAIVLYLRNLLINWTVFVPLFLLIALIPISRIVPCSWRAVATRRR